MKVDKLAYMKVDMEVDLVVRKVVNRVAHMVANMDFSIIFWEFLGEPMVPKPVQVWGWVVPGFWGPGLGVRVRGRWSRSRGPTGLWTLVQQYFAFLLLRFRLRFSLSSHYFQMHNEGKEKANKKEGNLS